jgi:hypothetical protein
MRAVPGKKLKAESEPVSLANRAKEPTLKLSNQKIQKIGRSFQSQEVTLELAEKRPTATAKIICSTTAQAKFAGGSIGDLE